MTQPAFTAHGVSVLEAFEGVVLKGYRDAVGVATIGAGHTQMAGGLIHYADGSSSVQVIIGKAITRAEADRLLQVDVANFARKIDALIKVQLNENQHDALLSFAFNVGPANFAKSSVLRAVNAGKFAQVPAYLAQWNKAGGRVLSGLVKRRAAEGKLFLDPAHYQVAMNDNYGPMANDLFDEPMAA